MELNTSGLHKRIPEMLPGPVILAEIAAHGIPMVLGSDSHDPGRVGADFERALDLLEAAGHRTVSVFRRRQRTDIPIPAARASLTPILAAAPPWATIDRRLPTLARSAPGRGYTEVSHFDTGRVGFSQEDTPP
jgi:hypothetical protein